MKILVINAGSSSLKYQFIDMEDESVVAKGICERIGIGGNITHKTQSGVVVTYAVDFPTHTEAFRELIKVLTSGEGKVIEDVSEITAIGHRVVQGAEKFKESVLITSEVLQVVIDVSELAPLHNPAAVQAIKACQNVFDSSVPQIAVFDTAFHQTMPNKAYMFGIPYKYYKENNVRRYGFHGTSHRYVSNRLAEILQRDNLEGIKVVTCHLGNGSSITAIDNGRSVDTSMGFTPLDGVIMGTRCGTIDTSVILYIAEKEGLTPKECSDLLNKQSGYLGISGLTSDDRDLRKAAAEGNKYAELAGTMQRYQIKKFIGAYAAAMGGIDHVIFTGGIGENSPDLRRDVCANMEFLGIDIDLEKNVSQSGKEVDLSKPNTKTKVWIIPTDEELLIARDTKEIVEKQ